MDIEVLRDHATSSDTTLLPSLTLCVALWLPCCERQTGELLLPAQPRPSWIPLPGSASLDIWWLSPSLPSGVSSYISFLCLGTCDHSFLPWTL